MKHNVSLLIVRTFPCEHDARINKLLYHLKKFNLEIGIVCVSRNRLCGRKSRTGITHYTKAYHTSPGRYYPFFQYARIVAQNIYLYFSLSSHISANFTTRCVVGTDFDGFLVACLSFPLKVKKIFEVYDPWTTLYNSRIIKFFERFFFAYANFLILPAEDSRIKVNKDKSFSLGNELLPPLLKELISFKCVKSEVEKFVKENRYKYILAGGSLGRESKITELIESVTSERHLSLVIIQTDFMNHALYKSISSDNIFFFDLQRDWGNWLYLLKHARATWCYYDDAINHFKDHISPNKYWESVLLGTPLLVNKISQFCDRAPTYVEPPLIELKDNIPNNLFDRFLCREINEFKPSTTDLKNYFLRLETMRDLKVKYMLSSLNII